jgi:hypothetical protein
MQLFCQVHEAMITAGIKSNIYHGKMGGKAREESHRSVIYARVSFFVWMFIIASLLLNLFWTTQIPYNRLN